LSLQNALRFRAAESDARTDHLTKLANIGQFIEKIDAQVEQSQSTGQPFCVIVCDLNSFKAVNDRYGHLKGNEVLRAIAREFRACCLPEELLARIGGDEFAFLLPSLQRAALNSRLSMIERAVQRACIALQIEVDIATSAGAASFPEDGASAEELLGVADRRMYRNKRDFYDANLFSEPPVCIPS
jgi:diguanylate cyclase (GGDEF)-like protein